MRGFQRDPQPAPGWTADWAIEDHLHYLANPADLHLRCTDLTRGAEVETAEAWVSVSQYGGTADAWIPSVLVRRRTEEPPLASTFAGILEPYEGKPQVQLARRLELRDADGKPCADGYVGIETQLADGSRDLFIANDAENSAGVAASVVEPESGARFEGDLCLVRLDKAKRPTRVLFCRGKTLRIGDLVIEAKDSQASFEVDIEKQEAPVVAGPAEAVASIQFGSARLWPK